VRFLAVHAAVGAMIGVVLAASLLTVAGLPLGSLILATETPIAAGLLYFGSFALTFASLAMGAGVMLLRDEDG
jgi:hypothetical protein